MWLGTRHGMWRGLGLDIFDIFVEKKTDGFPIVSLALPKDVHVIQLPFLKKNSLPIQTREIKKQGF